MNRTTHRRPTRGPAAAAPLALLLALSFTHAAVIARAQTERRGVELSRPPAAVTKLPERAKRFALVVGVDQYRDAQISPLRGAATDARMLADALVRYAGFPAEQVVLLATDQPEERQPTRVNIFRRLSNLSAAVPKDGLLLVSFAGHGMERGGRAYLLPSDSQLSDDVDFLEDTAVSVERVRERIRSTGVSQVIVLLDACRNDPGGRADAPNPLTEAFTRGFDFDVRNREVVAFATIYATRVGERAYEFTEKRQGYFTWAIVEGLRGGAANERGEVTLAALVRYVEEVVPKRVGVDLGAGKRQRPFAEVEGYRADELVVAVAPPRGAAQPAPDAGAVSADAVELAFWDGVSRSRDPEDFKAYLAKYPRGRFADEARARLDSLARPAASAAEKGSGRKHDYNVTYDLLVATEKLIELAARRGDKKMLEAVLADDFVLDDNGKVYSKTQFLSKIPAKNIKSYTFEGFYLKLDGDVAVINGSGRAVVQQLFLQARVRVHFVDRFEYRPGKGWLLVASQVRSTIDK